MPPAGGLSSRKEQLLKLSALLKRDVCQVFDETIQILLSQMSQRQLSEGDASRVITSLIHSLHDEGFSCDERRFDYPHEWVQEAFSAVGCPDVCAG